MEEAGFRNCVSVPDGAPPSVSPKELPPNQEVCVNFKIQSFVSNFITIYYLMQSMIEKLRNYSYLICDYVYFDNSGKTSLYLGISLRIISAI